MYDDVIDESTFERARAEVRDRPYGVARSAAAEALLAAAERLGGTPLVAQALLETIVAYNYGGESPKSAVSMGRLLRLYDEQPGEFTPMLTHGVYWHLKWVTSSLLAAPEVPLTTIRSFLDDMERRFRTAGHSMRPVHKCRFYLADHTGDKAAAAAEFAAWMAADRDSLTDCDACERREQGRWLAEQGDDEGALEIFGPTLSGMRTCAEEPQITISDSLLPLIRLGRLDEARTNHLRGYRLVRGSVSTYASVGKHIEFCALTGNEGRGVEITAAHRTWLASPAGDADVHLAFLGGVGVLLRRLVALGRGGLRVADVPGTDGTAAGLLAVVERDAFALAARFDARNGSDFVSGQLRTRLAAKPVVAALPLGVRSVLVPAPRPADPAREAGTGLDELADRARASAKAGHPGSRAAWELFAAAAAERGATVTDRDAADLADARAIDMINSGDVVGGIEQLRIAAQLFDATDRPGPAHVARARAVVSLRHPAVPDDVSADWAPGLDATTADLVHLVSQGRAEPADLVSVLAARMTAARLAFATATEDTQAAARAAYEAETDRLAAAAAHHRLGHRVAEAAEARAHLALVDGDHQRAEAELRGALTAATAAERPWAAAATGRLLGGYLLHHGDAAGAEEVLLGVLDAAQGPTRDPALYADVLAALTRASASNGRLAAAAEYAALAAQEFDRLGDRLGAVQCRSTLAALFKDLDRPADAAAILEECLPEVDELLGPDDVLHNRWMLGTCLSAAGHALEAADVLVGAAARAAAQDADPGIRATLAGEAAQTLAAVDRRTEAGAAFPEAIRLAGEAGRPGAAVRLTRAAAWNLIDGQYDNGADEDAARGKVDAGLAKFAEAMALLDAAAEDGPDLDRAHERAVTEVQWSQALWMEDRNDEALRIADRGATRLEIGLPRFESQYAQLVTVAARVEEHEFGMPELARSRVDAALLVARTLGAAEAVRILTELREEPA